MTGRKLVHAILKIIPPKVNEIDLLEIELIYYNGAIQYINHDARLSINKKCAFLSRPSNLSKQGKSAVRNKISWWVKI